MKITLKKLRERIASYGDAVVIALKSLAEIPSVYEESRDPEKPFGENVAHALDLACQMAKDAGATRVVNCAYYAYADFGQIEENTAYIGVFSHLDVVPAGDGWLKCDPFTPTLLGDVLYGRVVEDNKSGAVGALFALRALKEEGYTFAHPVRLYFGANEEDGMEDLHKFLADQKNLPTVSLVPDSAFPLSVGEKGICRFAVKTPKTKDILKVSGGVAMNVVTSECEVTLTYKEALLSELEDKIRLRDGYHLSYTNDEIHLKTVGIPAHASTPDGSKNAWKMAATLLAGCRMLNSSDREICSLVAQSLQDDYGTAFGIAHTDSRFGRLTCANGLVSVRDGCIVYTFDVRYGVEFSSESLEEKVTAKTRSVGCGWDCEILENKSGFHIANGLALTERLLALYRESSGDQNAMPFRMGGGTYARYLPNAYSIGTFAPYVGEHPVLPEGHGQVHGKDEYISIPMFCEAICVIGAMLAECDSSIDCLEQQ